MESNLTVKEIKALLPHGALKELADKEKVSKQTISTILNKEQRLHRLWPKILSIAYKNKKKLERIEKQEEELKQTLISA